MTTNHAWTDDAGTAMGRITSSDIGDPPDRAPRLSHLAELERDARHRAAAILNGQRQPTDPVLDLVRWLHQADITGTEAFVTAAEAADLTPGRFVQLRTAYQYGGLCGAEAALRPLYVDPEVMQRAEQTIRGLTIFPRPDPEIQRNRLIFESAKVEIRLGSDSCWYPFTNGTISYPVRGHDPDPIAAYKAAVAAFQKRT